MPNALLATPKKFAIQQVFEILLRRPVDRSIYAYLTDVKTSGLENTMEMVYPTGGRGNVYIGAGFAHSRRATFNVTVATWNTDVLAIQNGTEVIRGSSEITYYDVITADAGGKFYTKFSAIGSANQEIGYIYVVRDDGTFDDYPYEQASVASEGHFTYSSSTREIMFAEGNAPLAGEKIACAYTYRTASNAQRINVTSEGVPPVVLVSAYGLARDVCNGELFPCIIEGQAQVDGNWNFDISADGEPAVQNLNMEFVKGCIDNTLYDFTVYTEDEDLEAPDYITFSVPTGDLLGKDAAELASGLEINEAGQVTGTLNYVTDYTGFNGANVAEQNGYYFPFKVDIPEEADGTITGTITVTQGEDQRTINLDTTDGTTIIFMGADEATARTKQVSISIDWDSEGVMYPTENVIFDMREVVYGPRA